MADYEKCEAAVAKLMDGCQRWEADEPGDQEFDEVRGRTGSPQKTAGQFGPCWLNWSRTLRPAWRAIRQAPGTVGQGRRHV